MALTTSIAVCTYNGERFLQEQLDSLLCQSRPPEQIVIRDDGSSDRSRIILEAFQAQAHALGILVDLQFHRENIGYRRNFDTALRACDGDLIFLCDQDDVWHADKLERFVDTFTQRPALLALHSNATLIDSHGTRLDGSLFSSLQITPREVKQMHDGHGFNTLIRRNIITGATMAFRRELLADVLPLPAHGWVHDAWIGLIASMRGEVDTLEKHTISYRLHENNQLGVGKTTSRLPRKQHRMRQLSESRELTDVLWHHVQAMPGRLQRLDAVAVKRRHMIARTNLPAGLAARLPIILRELASGAYHRYGRGILSAGVDLLGR